MFRMPLLMLIIVSLLSASSCKRKVPDGKTGTVPGSNDANGTQTLPDLQGKPDKVSEEPTGLPGYPLACRWLSAPAGDTLDSSLRCFLADDQGQPAALSSKPTWSASVQQNASVISQVQPDQSLNLTVAAKTRDEIGAALLAMQLKIQWNGKEAVYQGKDLIKAEPQSLRLAATCKNLFTLLLVNDSATLSYLEINRFTGCEQLTSSLMNIAVPNSKYTALPDLHKTVAASCKDGLFQLTITQPQFQGSTSQGPIDPKACEDLRAFVNNLGL